MPFPSWKYLFSFLLMLFAIVAKPAIDFSANSVNVEYEFFGKNIDCFEDSTHLLTFDQIRSREKSGLFTPMRDYPVQFLLPNKVYWIRIELQNSAKTSENEWLVEFYDFQINHLEMYTPTINGHYLQKIAGFSYPFKQKEFQHKNFVFQLPYFEEGITFLYAKIKPTVPVTVRGRVTTISNFSSYASMEYFFLALFYGVCLAMIFYNLFLYITIRDKTYLYYIYYVFGAVLFASARDGLGFQFLWPNLQIINKYIFNFSNLFMIFWEIMYARSFLNTRKNQPVIDRFLRYIIVGRLVIYLITTFLLPEFSNQVSIDIITLAFIYYAGIVSYQNNYKPTFYYLVAFTCMLVGYVTFAFTNIGIISHNIFTIYSINLGLVIEMLLLSFALASRIKILQREKIQAQNETIKQLVVNEELKDTVNKELEQKVLERTKELETKNKELDAFVYKSSHDLKGPLNSISGLATIGMMEDDVTKMKEYFRLTRDTTRRLQSTIVDLLSLTKVKETTVSKRSLNISELLDEVVDNFAHDENYSQVVIQKKIEIEKEVVSDEGLMKSILQNLVENGLKYRDPRKENQKLDIYLKNVNGHITLKVSDNGIGIGIEDKKKVFDMFYKINPKSVGTGLGLHILKTAVEKLGGIIELESERGKGSTFTVQLPNEI